MNRALVAIAVAIGCAALVPRSYGQELEVAGALDDPGGRVGAALASALARAERGGPSARLVFWGASHTASDQYTSTIRALLRRRYGDGGSGLVLPSLPFSLYEMRDFDVPHVHAFEGRFVRGTTRVAGAYGRAGFALDVSREATATLVPRTAGGPGSIELWVEASGGTVALEIDGAEVAVLDTSASFDAPSPLARAHASLPEGTHTIGVHAYADAPVRIFGVSIERDAPGVVVEAFGVPGARARDQHPWDEASFAAQVALRPPDLVAIAYGTNESGDGTALRRVESDVDATLERLRRVAPGAACLVVGPSDRPRRRAGVWRARARSTEMAALYHRRASAHGCAFFDTLAWQGGAGSMVAWVLAGLGLDDHVHFTEEGYARLGAAVLRELGVLDAR